MDRLPYGVPPARTDHSVFTGVFMFSNLLIGVLPVVMQLPALDTQGAAYTQIPAPVVADSVAPTRARAVPPVARQAKAPTRFVLAIDGNEARYRVREQLAGIDFPSDAVGKTAQVQGSLLIGADGKLVRDSSRFTVDLRTLESDQTRRDGFIKRNTIKTDSFPEAVFVPGSAQGLPTVLLATGEMAFTLTGDLTVHGVTKPVTWQVKAKRIASGAVTGNATTDFKFGDFGMTIPKVGRVLSVDDKITLEYDFHLVPQAPSK
jgi:polyisoprenoid-binding protein YceI